MKPASSLIFRLLLFASSLLFSCTPPAPTTTSHPTLFVYRFDPPAFLEFSEDLQVVRELPFSPPPHCGLFDVFGAPGGAYLAVELSCPNGQTVLLLDTDTNIVIQPIQDTDSHFLAWSSNGDALYLKVDSLGDAHVARVRTDGTRERLSISPFTYDLASSPRTDEYTFTLSQGMGKGSELYLTQGSGRDARLLYADPYFYISFARFSPDGEQIAFIKVPDSATPFTVGELWVMGRDGANALKLSDADAGHGYRASWSPEGKHIAFVVRENPEDEQADRQSTALISNIAVIDVGSSEVTQISRLDNERAETPHWSPDGNTLAFHIVVDDRMEVRLADLLTGEIRSLSTEPTCCPAWLRK